MGDVFLHTVDFREMHNVYMEGVESTLQYLKTGSWPGQPLSGLMHHAEYEYFDAFQSLDTVSYLKIALCTGLEHMLNSMYPALSQSFQFPDHFSKDRPFSLDVKNFAINKFKFRGELILWDASWDTYRHSLGHALVDYHQPDLHSIVQMVLPHLITRATSPSAHCAICEQQGVKVDQYVDEDGHFHVDVDNDDRQVFTKPHSMKSLQ
ncbi:hypothetical protein LLE49_25920 [Alicyclobacillus tolerans]|uniref:hypothetical protein n=1 Tax=Alicyclobacillus tolerans TaxID=90970 RepID=UPI001F16FBC9|nr:hypothetical protein [Alicyclobacillus tolerans]MCF8568167.1 hypothetical protein [Alicyclobacillus tolerans]